jgi:hypothetical protein
MRGVDDQVEQRQPASMLTRSMRVRRPSHPGGHVRHADAFELWLCAPMTLLFLGFHQGFDRLSLSPDR